MEGGAVLLCPMIWANKVWLPIPEESLHTHLLDTAASGFEHSFKNNEYCALGSCFTTECGLSSFWNPGWV